ncbi:HupE/UreJ family protein [Agromyces sp. SYSU K20354]|uniref:HupE/UreJ family protein n=1 Tax=Agromyces cavernae TaxID=2898659 RepID=UPI001E4628C5|nr:HupE/UreJ family protein [Agromyces cavernae]MCD2442963.1 HupE/UreJ family protein [Agromyces cavernae]
MRSRGGWGPVLRAAMVVVIAMIAAMSVALGGSAPRAAAHDATSDAYAVVERHGSTITAELELEYDLLMKSAWLYAEAYEAKERDEQLRQLAENADAVEEYVTERFAVDADGRRCVPERAGTGDIRERNDRAFAVVRFSYDCGGREPGAIAVSSALFPDAEGFVHSTETIVAWDLDGERGNGLLDAASPTLELDGQSPRFGEFFLLGAEHLLIGLDHLLFLFALLLGARTIRSVALTATMFTVAHSVTFLLAGMGVVNLPAIIVEPLIALSIVAAAVAVVSSRDASGRWRMPVVFAFGLLHGLGFAGALGVDEAWSWELLWSLIAFNLGIEAVQLAIIAVMFPLLVLVRRTAAGRPTTWIAGALVGSVGLFWFVERVIAAL